MATNYNRPNLPYKAESLPNSNRYALLAAKKQPPTAVAVDGDINYIVDSLNDLDTKITDVEAGVLVGANNPQNAGLFVTTDGNAEAPTILWKKVDATNVVPGSLTTACLADGAVTNDELGVGCVETENLSPNCVTSPTIAPHAILPEHINPEAVTTPAIKDQAIVTAKIADGAVTTPKLALKAVTQAQIADLAVGTPQLIDGSTTTGKLADQSVTNPKIGLLAVTAPQISSANAAIGTVLTSGAGSEATWSAIPTTGKILQLVPLVYTQTTLNEYDALCSPTNLLSFKSGALAVTVTPLKSGNESTILIYYALTLGGRASGGGDCAVTLCKNASIFSAGSKGVTHFCSYNGNLNSDAVFTCANLFTDKAQISGTPITYELKKALPYTNINSSYSGGAYGSFVSTMIVVEVQI